MYARISLLVAVLAAMVIISGCGAKKVTRIDPGQQIDYSGHWNDTDSRMVAAEMVSDVMSRPWLGEYSSKHAKKPAVIVGRIRNLTSEHIETETFIKSIERELINNGKISFVASKDERSEIREERVEQQSYASEATAKKIAAETGADYMLQGSIKSIEDATRGKELKFYQVDLEMIHIESNEKVWIGTKEIKKAITNPGYKP